MEKEIARALTVDLSVFFDDLDPYGMCFDDRINSALNVYEDLLNNDIEALIDSLVEVITNNADEKGTTYEDAIELLKRITKATV